MQGGELDAHAVAERLDQCFGNTRIGGARLARRDRPGDDPDTDEKPLFAPDNARPVERVLIVGGLRDGIADEFLQLRRRRHRTEKSGVEHRIEESRPPADDLREPRRRAHDVGEEAQ